MLPNNIIERVWNQNRMVSIEDLKGMTFQAESGGHTFNISGVDDAGNIVALAGSVAGVFLRPDNTDVAITGSSFGGVVSVTLPAECYDVPGRFGLTVFVTDNGQKTAVYAAIGTVSRTSSGAVSPGTTSDVVDLINQITAAVATIPASWSGLMADIAPTYSPDDVYPVGAYCYYNGDLHRCIVPITTAESWNSAHWETAVIGDDLKGLADDLEAETEERKAAVEDLQDALYAPTETTATEITDAVPMPLESLALAMAPKQDLNGYSKPWVGGAGKNQFNPALFVDRTAIGVTSEVQADGTIHLYGTPSATARYNSSTDNIILPAGTYCVTGSPNEVRIRTGSTIIDTNGVFTSDGVTPFCLNVTVVSGISIDIYEKIQIELGSTETAYEPYSNICPITGWDTVKVERTGKNLLDATNVLNAFINTSTMVIANNANARSVYAPCKPNTTYTISKTAGTRFIVAETSDVPAVGVAISNNITHNTAGSISITTSASAKYLVAFVWLSTADTSITADEMLSSVQLELGSTATEYEPYQGQTIIHNIAAAAGGTVYGGTLMIGRDGTGTLVVDRVSAQIPSADILYASSALVGRYFTIANYFSNLKSEGELLCNAFLGLSTTSASTDVGVVYISSSGQVIFNTPFDTLEKFKVWINDNAISVVYELATPQTYTLTTEQVTTLLGYNRITSDAEITGLAYYKVNVVDISGKADKTDTVLETTLSRGRTEGSTVGTGSIAFGQDVTASGQFSHAEGVGTKANSDYQHVFGRYNAVVSGLEVVGNGTMDSNRSNARVLDSDGNESLAGHIVLDSETSNKEVISAEMFRLLMEWYISGHSEVTPLTQIKSLSGVSGYTPDFASDVYTYSLTKDITSASLNVTLKPEVMDGASVDFIWAKVSGSSATVALSGGTYRFTNIPVGTCVYRLTMRVEYKTITTDYTIRLTINRTE